MFFVSVLWLFGGPTLLPSSSNSSSSTSVSRGAHTLTVTNTLQDAGQAGQ
jgi:hypothetical protein